MLSDLELAVHALPESLIRLHKFERNEPKVRELAIASVKELAKLEGEEFEHYAKKTLILLAVLDHMNDQRTAGMIADYLDF